MSEIHQKLRKLLTLARQGVGGEMANAQSRLEAMMQKHGITIDELEDEQLVMQWFKPAKGTLEKRLLYQVVRAVCGKVTLWESPKKRGQLGVQVTKSQHLEINLRYPAYVAAMQKEMAICYSAFVQTNQIFHNDSEPADLSTIDLAELKRIHLAMRGMTPLEIHRTLTNTP